MSQLLGAGLSRAYALETARQEAAGRPVESMEDFAAHWLPQAEKTSQAAYDASLEPSAATAAPRKSKKPGGPVDVISFIRARGGLRNDEGHDLSKGRGYSSRPGLINRKGSSVDQVGEALWEAGYFGPGAARPTEDEVLQLIEKGFREKTYAPTDALEMAVDKRQPVEEVTGEIHAAAKAQGFELGPEDEDFAMMLHHFGYEPEDAAYGAFELRKLSAAADALDAAAEAGVKGHDYAETSARLRAAITERVRSALEGDREQHVPGFDEPVDRILAGRGADSIPQSLPKSAPSWTASWPQMTRSTPAVKN
jgi:hypothetical protein